MLGRLGMLVVIAFGIVFATCAGFYCLGGLADRGTTASTPHATEPEESDHDILLRKTKNDSDYAAQEVIKAFLKAPSQARFSDRELLDRKENFALVRMTVDAPNSFGVMLRAKWCAIVSWQPPRGESFNWSKVDGAWECGDDQLDRDQLLWREGVSGWPGAAEELAARLPGKKHRPRARTTASGQ